MSEILQIAGPSRVGRGRYDQSVQCVLIELESKGGAAVEGLTLADLMKQAQG